MLIGRMPAARQSLQIVFIANVIEVKS